MECDDYKVNVRCRRLELLLGKIVEDATEEEISALSGYLQWLERQIEDRKKVRSAA